MTNGEKFKEVFKISQVDEGELYAFVMLPTHEVADISIDWWNAEYKEPSSSEIPTSSIIDWNNCHTSEQLESIATTKNDLGVDAISRADARSLICKIDLKHHTFGMSRKAFKDLYNGMDELPSVTPQEPQSFKWCTNCKEYDQEKHCCHRYSKVIRDTVEEMKQEPKSEWEYDHAILKAYSDGANEVLDKIRDQIKSHLKGVEITLEVLVENDPLRPKMEGAKDTLEECLEIIDRAESEG